MIGHDNQRRSVQHLEALTSVPRRTGNVLTNLQLALNTRDARDVYSQHALTQLQIDSNSRVPHSSIATANCIFIELISSVCMLHVQESESGVIALERMKNC